MIINTVELLDKAIAETADGLEIYINDVQTVTKLKEILQKDRNGRNKIYIKPDNDQWDVRIVLKEGYALYGDILTQIRSLAGVSKVKEI